MHEVDIKVVVFNAFNVDTPFLSLLVVPKVDETNPTFGWRVRETQLRINLKEKSVEIC